LIGQEITKEVEYLGLAMQTISKMESINCIDAIADLQTRKLLAKIHISINTELSNNIRTRKLDEFYAIEN